MASRLGVQFEKKWTPECITVLRSEYPNKGGRIPELLDLGFQKHAIEKMASRLEIRRDRSTIKYVKKVDQWEEGDISKLKEKFSFTGASIPELLEKYTKSEINSKAKQLGFKVKRGRPQKVSEVANQE